MPKQIVFFLTDTKMNKITLTARHSNVWRRLRKRSEDALQSLMGCRAFGVAAVNIECTATDQAQSYPTCSRKPRMGDLTIMPEVGIVLSDVV